MERILITGGTGFAGSHLFELLQSQTGGDEDREVHLTHFGKTFPDFFHSLPTAQLHQLNLLDQDAVFALIESLQPTQIYHLAAFASVGQSFLDSAGVLKNNVGIEINLLEAVTNFSPKARTLIVGSAEEYGSSEPGELPITEHHPFRPTNPYAISKLSQDLLSYCYVKNQQLDIVRVRPFNHTGERQTRDFVVPSFAAQIVAVERGEQSEIAVGNLAAKRDISDVKDVVRAYSVLMEKGITGEVYNVGSGESVAIQQVLDELVAMARVSVPVRVDKTRVRPIDIPDIVADCSKMKQLGWSPLIPRAQTLQRVLDWWRTQPTTK